MRFPWLTSLAVCGVLLTSAGCSHLDVRPEGALSHVATGVIKCPATVVPPPDSEWLVRVAAPGAGGAAAIGAGNDLIVDRHDATSAAGSMVAEQIIRAPAAVPVSFRIPFRADEERLRRGLNLEARISWGGRVRLRTIEPQLITPTNVNQPYTLWVEPVD